MGYCNVNKKNLPKQKKLQSEPTSHSDHGPTKDGLLTEAFLWSNDCHRLLIMCSLMKTFRCLDNYYNDCVYYKHVRSVTKEFSSVWFCLAGIRSSENVFVSVHCWMGSSKPENVLIFVMKFIITDSQTFAHAYDLV